MLAVASGGSAPAQTAEPVGALDFGSIRVRATSPAQQAVFTFTAAGTLAGTPYAVLTTGDPTQDFQAAAVQPGTVCVTGHLYSFGETCTVDVTFTPIAPGLRYGAVVLFGLSGDRIATAYVHGIGAGPQINFLPGVLSRTLTGFSNPEGVAADTLGNVFVSDTGDSTVWEYPSDGGARIALASSNPAYVGIALVNAAGEMIYPQSLDIDGAGNLYWADSATNKLFKMTASGASGGDFLPALTVIPTSSLASPYETAVDVAGNIYVADTGNARILKETLNPDGSYTESVVANSSGGLISPAGVSVDVAGNVYVSDITTNFAYKITPSGSAYDVPVVIPTSTLSQPYGLTADPLGNIFIADTITATPLGRGRVLKETLQPDNSYVESVIWTDGLNAPFGVAVDRNGNVYIADTVNYRVLELDFADPPGPLNFATTHVGSTSTDSSKTVTIENIGNAPLIFPVPETGTNPDASPASFTVSGSGGTPCPLTESGALTAGELAVNDVCELAVSFTPTEAASIAGALTLTDDSLNAPVPAYAAQAIVLNGIGWDITLTPALADGVYGAAYSETVTASGGVTPPYGFAVTVGSSPPGLTLSPSGVLSGTPTAPGSYTFTVTATDSTLPAGYDGTQEYTIVIAKATPVVTLTSSLNPSQVGQPVTFTATVSAGATGTIDFEDNGTSINASCDSVTISGTTATCETSELALGAHPVTAVYSGDDNFDGATSETLTQVVNDAACGTNNFGQIPAGQRLACAVVVTIASDGTAANINELMLGAAEMDFLPSATTDPGYISLPVSVACNTTTA
ncbi:MAG: Ig-like domain repeat protein, partial [Acidobacteriaceae bacterium]|nr:Ig-like domain repeat protein [Acidobacteriaceae bacterium]